jgi:transcriptional regulator with XRE-family HTH domain
MPSDFKRQFGLRVRRLRLARRLSQEQLATAARLHPTHISLIEGGHRSVRLETIESLARALHVQPSRLIPSIEWACQIARRLRRAAH